MELVMFITGSSFIDEHEVDLSPEYSKKKKSQRVT